MPWAELMPVTTDRILDLSEGGFRLRAENRQLILERKDEEARSVPFEELAVLIVSNAWTTYSHTVLTTLAANHSRHGHSNRQCHSVSECPLTAFHSITARRPSSWWSVSERPLTANQAGRGRAGSGRAGSYLDI